MTDRPTDSEIRNALSVLLASEQFRASEKRAAFLSYVVDESLAGRSETIKGYSIGLEVYGRGEEFDPQSDPIVRLEAGRLRRELEHYYLTDGINAEIVFELPRGTYVPRIKRAEQTAEHVAAQEADGERQSRPAASRLLGPAAAFAMGLVVATLAGVFIERLSGHGRSEREQSANETVTRSTVYVTPFEPLGADAETVALSRGLTQEMIGVLANFPELEVFPVNREFVDGQEPSQAASRTGQPSYVFRGSARIVDDRLRILAGLQDADDGRQIWGEQFDAAFVPARVFDIQQSIATSVARKLGEPFGVLRSSARQELRNQIAPGLESYRCVLLAYEYRGKFDAETHKRARDCLEEATLNDPDYARAWALLAYLAVDEVRLYYNPLPDSLERAIAAAEKSVELDATDPLSYQALSVTLFTAGRIEPALEAARRAVELNPDNKEALWQLGFRYWLTGNHEEGVALARRAIDESPSAPRWYHWVLAAEFYRLGRYEQARAAAEYMRTPDLPFIEALRAMIYGQLGEQDAATRSLEICRTLDPQFDKRARETFARNQIGGEVLDHFMDGLVKAGLRTDQA